MNITALFTCHKDNPLSIIIIRTDNQERPGSFTYRLRSEVEEVIQDVVGGKEYYKRWTFSPYYHTISKYGVMEETISTIKRK